jgi:hypothetical protein
MTFLRKYLLQIVILYGAMSILVALVFVLLAIGNDGVDFAGIGQLILAGLGLPVLLLTLSVGVTELKESIAKPKLKLIWAGDLRVKEMNGWGVLTQSSHSIKYFAFMLYVQNAGNVSANTYQITVDIPAGLANPLSEHAKFEWHMGNKPAIRSGASIQGARHILTSKGQYVLFPSDQLLHVATFTVQLFPNQVYPQHMHIKYSVVTDKTTVQHERYRIRVVPESWL